MNKEIIRKLHDHLSRPLNTECAVVYFLAQIRKVLEDELDGAAKPASLWMHCNWALHVDLTYDHVTMHFLKRIDSFIRNNVATFTKDDDFKFKDENNLFQDFEVAPVL